METEIENRIQKAWKTFFSHRKQLCSRSFAIRRRLQLFNSTVTAVMLYGSGTWTLKADDLRRLQAEQRKMLRMMLNIPRKVGEGVGSTDDEGEEEEEEEEEEQEIEAEDVDNDGDTLLEDWVSWVRRATRIAEAELEKAHVTDWVREQRGKYWDLAGRVAR